jgi:hypothetical protein
MMDDQTKKRLITYSGLLFLLLVALYLLRNVFNPLSGLKYNYDIFMDSIQAYAFSNNEVPSDYHRPQ